MYLSAHGTDFQQLPGESGAGSPEYPPPGEVPAVVGELGSRPTGCHTAGPHDHRAWELQGDCRFQQGAVGDIPERVVSQYRLRGRKLRKGTFSGLGKGRCEGLGRGLAGGFWKQPRARNG